MSTTEHYSLIARLAQRSGDTPHTKPSATVVALTRASPPAPTPRRTLTSRSLGDFLARRYPPVEHVLDPWFPVRGIVMVAGYRGIGKTRFGLAVAYAIATGGSILGFRAPKPRKVLYVDGEMDPAELQGRLDAIHRTAVRDGNGDPTLAAANLHILSHADQELGIPDLADPEGAGRAMVEERIVATGAEVLVLDNLSVLCRTGVENDAESWAVMQEWLVKLRRQGRSTLLVHHTGKPDDKGNVTQRGTSKREDVLNTSILLKPPSKTAKPGEMTIVFTKARGFLAPEPFTVRVVDENGFCEWHRPNLDLKAEIAALLQAGISQQEIAKRLNVSEATVSRHKPKEPAISLKPLAEGQNTDTEANSMAFTESEPEIAEIA